MPNFGIQTMEFDITVKRFNWLKSPYEEKSNWCSKYTAEQTASIGLEIFSMLLELALLDLTDVYACTNVLTDK